MGTTPVVFDYTTFTDMFPELSGVTDPAATIYFGMATMYIRNDGGGPVNDPVKQSNMLYLTTAHIARLLSQQTNGVPTTGGTDAPSPLVGRISSAAEGSVNVSAEMVGQTASSAWWQQTQYGALVWQMLATYRTMRYLARPQRRYNPPRGFRRYY